MVGSLFFALVAFVRLSTKPFAGDQGRIAFEDDSLASRGTAGEDVDARCEQASSALKEHFAYGDAVQHHRTDGSSDEIGCTQMEFVACWSACAILHERFFELSFAHSGDELYIAFPDRKSTRLNSSHRTISYAVFC